MTWVYTQVKYIDGFSPLVLTENTTNQQGLPKYPLACLSSNLERQAYKNFHRLGIRLTPPVYDQAIREFRPTLIRSHFGDRGWYDLPMARKYRLQQVVTFYGYDVGQLPIKQPVWR